MLRTAQRLPVDEKRDRVLGLGNTVVRLARRDTGRSARNNACWDGLVLQDPAANVDVVRRKVVARKSLSLKRKEVEIEVCSNLISESFPAHARNVSSWLFGWLIHALKKLNSPSVAARALASLYTGSKLKVTSRMKSTSDPKTINSSSSEIISPLMMLYEAHDIILPCRLDELDVVCQLLCRRFRHQDVDPAFECIK